MAGKQVSGVWNPIMLPYTANLCLLVLCRCACDVPAHMYTYTWEGNPFWSKAYVGSDELFAYFKGRAVAYGADEFVRLEHQVTEATWLDDVGKWRVHVKNLRSDESFYDEAEVLINAAGFLKHVYSKYSLQSDNKWLTIV